MTLRFSRSLPAVAAAIGLSVILAACSNKPANNLPPCPKVGILGDAYKATQYREGPGRDLTDVAYDVQLLDYNGGCKYDDVKNIRAVTVSFALQVAATRGPAASGPEAQVPYFVAVVDSEKNVLTRERFVARVPFKEGQRRVVVAEDLEQIIPLTGRRTTQVEILVGLELPRDQLERNRQQRGF